MARYSKSARDLAGSAAANTLAIAKSERDNALVRFRQYQEAKDLLACLVFNSNVLNLTCLVSPEVVQLARTVAERLGFRLLVTGKTISLDLA